jgi:hypothetical protein
MACALWAATVEQVVVVVVVVVVLEAEQEHSAAGCNVPTAAAWRLQVTQQRSRSKETLMLLRVLVEQLVAPFRSSVPASSGPRMVETD